MKALYLHKSRRIKSVLFGIHCHGEWKTLHIEFSGANWEITIFPLLWDWYKRQLASRWKQWWVGPVKLSIQKGDYP